MVLIVLSVHFGDAYLGVLGDVILGVRLFPAAEPLTVDLRPLNLGPILGAYFGTIIRLRPSATQR